jgi:hypothetical protein
VSTYYQLFPPKTQFLHDHAREWRHRICLPDLSLLGNCTRYGFRSWKLGCAIGGVDECFDLEAAQRLPSGRGKTLCIQLATCPRITSVFNFDLGFSAKLRQIMAAGSTSEPKAGANLAKSPERSEQLCNVSYRRCSNTIFNAP